MSTTLHPTAATPHTTARPPADPTRKTALVAGVLYIVTFASSIPAKFIFVEPVLANPDFMTRTGIANPLLWGSAFDVITALAGIGTAVTLFPLLKRQHEGFALGFVTTRLFEAAMIAVGIVSLLTVVDLHQSLGTAGVDTASAVTTGTALAATYTRAFELGPILMAVCNASLLGTLMLRSGLVPRAIPRLGLVGAVVGLVSTIGLLFGLHEQSAPTHMLAFLPIGLWELSIGFYMAVKGFRPPPLTAVDVAAGPRP